MNGPVLRDIHLPPAPWWPLAPGWWALLAVLLLAALGVAWWLHRRAQRGPLRAALREIDTLAAAHAADGDDDRLADGASRLLRRIALRIDPGAAAEDGAAWTTFVHTHARDADTRHALDDLAVQRFRAQPSLDAQAVLAALRNWCRIALCTRTRTPFHGKGGANANARAARAPQARGDVTLNAKTHPPQSPFLRKGEGRQPPGTRGNATGAESTLHEPTP